MPNPEPVPPTVTPATPPASPGAAPVTPPASTPDSTPASTSAAPGTILTPSAEGNSAGASAPSGKVDPINYDLKRSDDSILSQADADAVIAYAKANNLTQESAQKLLETQESAVKRFAEEATAKTNAEIANWAKLAETDKEIGGAEFGKNAELARRVVERFGSAEFRDVLASTGVGNNPELLRVFVRIGKAMSEDQFIKPGAQPEVKTAPEDILYPSHKKA